MRAGTELARESSGNSMTSPLRGGLWTVVERVEAPREAMSSSYSPTAKALSSSVYTSETFRSLQAWDDEAEKTVAELESLLPDLIARRDMAHALYAEKRAEWKSKGYFRTLFRSSNPPVEEARALHSIEDTADAMQAQTRTLLELMDMTPNNDQERNAFIKSVRLGIEELQLQERELATSVRRSNQAACQMTLDATTSLWNLDKERAAWSSEWRRSAFVRPNNNPVCRCMTNGPALRGRSSNLSASWLGRRAFSRR